MLRRSSGWHAFSSLLCGMARLELSTCKINMKTLRSLFLNELADMYDSERRIARTWPRFIKAAPSKRLQRVLHNHLKDTEYHETQIERIFAAFDEIPRSQECPTMVNILSEGQKSLAEKRGTAEVEETIVFVCEKVEHYEIASYATLRACAKTLGNQQAVRLIEEILDQEREADRALSEFCPAPKEEGEMVESWAMS